jgi:diacylglycerol kinase (ATP)
MSRDVALLVNPTAGKGRGARLAEPVAARLRDLGCSVRVLAGADPAQAARLAREQVAAGVQVLAVLGGDGMVHLAVQEVAGSGTLLGVLPAGTGNDLAASCGVPADPMLAAEVVAGGQPRTVDLGRATAPPELSAAPPRWWGTVLCAGFDSAVNERANLMRWPRGRWRYDLATYAELAMLRPRPATVVMDGEVWQGEVTQVDIGNGTSYGGGLRICPDAQISDGLLDVAIVLPMSRAKLVALKPKLPTGGLRDHPAVLRRRAKTVRVEMPGAVAYADGERVGPLPLDIDCMQGALRILG